MRTLSRHVSETRNCLANLVYRRCELRRNPATSFPDTHDRPQVFDSLSLSLYLSLASSLLFPLKRVLITKVSPCWLPSPRTTFVSGPCYGKSIILQLTKIPLVTRSRKATTRPHVHQLSREVA